MYVPTPFTGERVTEKGIFFLLVVEFEFDGYLFGQRERFLTLRCSLTSRRKRSNSFLITTQAKRNLSSFSGIGGVLSAT